MGRTLHGLCPVMMGESGRKITKKEEKKLQRTTPDRKKKNTGAKGKKKRDRAVIFGQFVGRRWGGDGLLGRPGTQKGGTVRFGLEYSDGFVFRTAKPNRASNRRIDLNHPTEEDSQMIKA